MVKRMDTKKNILILSCGTRNKVVQAFKKLAQIGKVICTDSSPYAPALYEGDQGVIVPRITDPDYLQILLRLCEEHQIDGLLSLIDPELSIIAANRAKFLELGVLPMISEAAAVENCFDKNAFASLLRKNRIPAIDSCSSISDALDLLEQGDFKFPLMLKPARGSASIGLNKIQNRQELLGFSDLKEEIIIQRWIDFQEYGVDCYVDMLSGKLSAMFIKKKLKMRAGETDKAISVHDVLIKETLLRFFEKYPYQFRGTIDFDIFSDGNECFISEINPRFGGGYPHAQAAGLNYPELYLNNLNGIANQDFIDFEYESGIVMMKYNEVLIKNSADIIE